MKIKSASQRYNIKYLYSSILKAFFTTQNEQPNSHPFQINTF